MVYASTLDPTGSRWDRVRFPGGAPHVDVAQLAERSAVNGAVGGSSPSVYATHSRARMPLGGGGAAFLTEGRARPYSHTNP